jgi:hypothetical protein
VISVVKAWLAHAREDRLDEALLLLLEALVSFQIAGLSSLVIPAVVGWNTPMTPQVIAFTVVWIVSAFVISFGLLVRAHVRACGCSRRSKTRAARR